MTTPSPTLLRAVTYERYSSDKQNAKSIDAQRHENAEFVAGQGCQLVRSYGDHEVSGKARKRAGLMQLMEDAEAGEFDIVGAFELDRLSRRMSLIATCFEELREFGIQVFCNRREVTTADVAMGGYASEEYPARLRAHTRCGLSQKVREGKSAGGICYGYRVDTAKNDPLKPGGMGHRVVDPFEAAIVRRILEEYARGGRKRTSQRPGWSGSTLNGNRKRGTGILNNELYVGRLVWGG